MPKQNMDESDTPMIRAARYRAEQAVGEPGRPEAGPTRRSDDSAVRADAAVDLAVARGDFENLAYAGKPLPELSATLSPDWWLQGLIQRENLTGLGPPAIMLRKEDTELDAELDKQPAEIRVREMVEEFNARVVAARRQLLGGPPVVTKLREVEQEVLRWRERRAARNPASEPQEAPKNLKNRARIWSAWFRR